MQALYTVAQILTVQLSEGQKRLTLISMFADQELDARSSGLPDYWEGLVCTQGGRGYLEIMGYAAPVVMSYLAKLLGAFMRAAFVSRWRATPRLG